MLSCPLCAQDKTTPQWAGLVATCPVRPRLHTAAGRVQCRLGGLGAAVPLLAGRGSVRPTSRAGRHPKLLILLQTRPNISQPTPQSFHFLTKKTLKFCTRHPEFFIFLQTRPKFRQVVGISARNFGSITRWQESHVLLYFVLFHMETGRETVCTPLQLHYSF
jgi:hypothetical protein